MENILWSQELQFWIDVVQGTNLACQGRELIAYYAYRFNIGTNETYIRGLEAGLNTEHFITEFGPTTLEQTNPYYSALKNTTYCCLWNGQSWPFSTSTYLTTLALMARQNVSTVATPQFFYDALETYARTNYKDGIPYTAESHYPTIDMWSGDTSNHSEHYFHSTFADNIFTNLIGIVPTFENELQLQPLIPSNWTHFAVENLPYHGSLISIVWDSTGSCYQGLNGTRGLSVYSNGTLVHTQPNLAPVNITLPFDAQTAASQLDAAPEWQNILANTNSPYGLPNITADVDFSANGDEFFYPAWKMNNGLLWYDINPQDFWGANQSVTPYQTINVTLTRPRTISSISLGISSDESASVVCPAGLIVRDWETGLTIASRNNWTDCTPNALNTIAFSDPKDANTTSNATTPATGYNVTTDRLQIVISAAQYYSFAIPEIQIWVPPVLGPRWEAEDGLIGTFIGAFAGRPTGLNGTIVEDGVSLGAGGWVELGGVRTSDGKAANTTLTVVGRGTGTIEVGLNWLTNTTVTFDGSDANKTINVNLVHGNNVVDMFQTSGTPFIDAIIVGS